jgi:hypothetical protein
MRSAPAIVTAIWFLGLGAATSCRSAAPPQVSTTTPRSAEMSRAPAATAPAQVQAEVETPLAPPSIDGLSIDLSLSGVHLETMQARTIAQAYARLGPAGEPVRAEIQRLGVILRDAAANGTFDRPRVRAELDRVNRAAAAFAPAIDDTVDLVHDTLTPTQRAAVHGAYSMRWRASTSPARPTTFHTGLALSDVADRIGLDGSVREAARADLEKASRTYATAEDHAQHRKTMTAFRSNLFDAKKLGVGDAYLRNVRASTEQTAEVVAALVPRLDPAQRARLADLVAPR